MADLFIIFFLLIYIGHDLPRGHLMKELTQPFARIIRTRFRAVINGSRHE